MLKVKNISKKYKGFELKPLSFDVSTGSYTMILGQSGAGKTILMEILSGLLKPDSGEVLRNNENILTKEKEGRIAIVFQKGNLFPHMTVEQNLQFPLKAQKIPKFERANRISDAIEQTGIEYLLKRYPAQISGGEAQRVALARALVSNASLILLDEPLSAVDVERRDDLIQLLKRVGNQGRTIIHVTHNVEETFKLADYVVILQHGTLQQHGKLDAVIKNPCNSFVARLFGFYNYFENKIDLPVQIHRLIPQIINGTFPLIIDPTLIKISLFKSDKNFEIAYIKEVTKTINGKYIVLNTIPTLTAFVENSHHQLDEFTENTEVRFYIQAKK